MEKEQRLIKELHSLEKEFIICRIILVIKEVPNCTNTIRALDQLLNDCYQLLNLYQNEPKNELFNQIDNNLFEMDNLVDDLKAIINPLCKLENYIYLSNQNINNLVELYKNLDSILSDGINYQSLYHTLTECQKTIMENYFLAMKDYLDYKTKNQLEILLTDDVSISSWNYYYKTLNSVIKSNQQLLVQDHIKKAKSTFELAYFVLSMGV